MLSTCLKYVKIEIKIRDFEIWLLISLIGSKERDEKRLNLKITNEGNDNVRLEMHETPAECIVESLMRQSNGFGLEFQLF